MRLRVAVAFDPVRLLVGDDADAELGVDAAVDVDADGERGWSLEIALSVTVSVGLQRDLLDRRGACR